MSILKVAQLGHPILRQLAQKVDAKDLATPETQTLIENMIETMREYDGVGLAAPQVHVSQQIAVMEIGDNPRYPDQEREPVTVFVNPVIGFKRLIALVNRLIVNTKGFQPLPFSMRLTTCSAKCF
jgi:peptide deformylase